MRKMLSFLFCIFLLLSLFLRTEALAAAVGVVLVTSEDVEGDEVIVTVDDPDTYLWVEDSRNKFRTEENTCTVGPAQVHVQDAAGVLIEGDLKNWRNHPGMKGVPSGASHDQPALVVMALGRDTQATLNGSISGSGETVSRGASVWINSGTGAALTVNGDICCGSTEPVKYGSFGLSVAGDDSSRTGIAGRADISVNGSIRAVAGEIESAMCTALEIYAYEGGPLEGTVRVTGDVCAEGGGYAAHGIDFSYYAAVAVEVGGSVTARSSSGPATGILCAYVPGGSAAVAGDVTAEGKSAFGINAEGGAVITVDGDVYAVSTGTGEYSTATGISAVNSNVTVNGNVTAKTVRRQGTGIELFGSSRVAVNGDVQAADGVMICLAATDQEPGTRSTLIICGSIRNDFQYDIMVNCYTYDPESGGFLPLTLEDSKKVLPTLVLREIDPEEGLVVASEYSPVDEKIIRRTILSRSRYLITYDDLTAPDWLVVEGTEDFEGYTVAREETVLTVRNARPGRELIGLDAGKYAEVTRNEDGSFSITVKRGGDLRLTATYKTYNTLR